MTPALLIKVVSPALLVLMQEVSSMTGRVLDSWTLQKPAQWQPDAVVRNLFEQYFISNYTETDFLEKTGVPLPCALYNSLAE